MKGKARFQKWKRHLALLILCAIGIAAFVFFGILPARVGRQMNTLRARPPYTISEAARTVHDALFIADLHADSLLWCRDLSERSEWGHVDIPRLREANVAIQTFTAVTKSPAGQNIHINSADTRDQITALVIAQRWPPRTWFSLCERALYQARRMQEFVTRDDRLILLRTSTDLERLAARRLKEKSFAGVLLGIEGLHCLEGELDSIDTLFAAGFRMMAPTHFFDNELGGSAHGESNGGLTPFGREAIHRMDERKIIIDLAHASAALIDDVLAQTSRPVLVSHSGVRGTCDNERNLSDEQIQAIAAGGGLIGIGLWKTAVCGEDAADTARAMKYVADLVGVEHVALGSDFDGNVRAPFDVTGLPLVTDELVKAGFSDDDIGRIMGGNVREFLLHNLPVE